MQVGVDIGGTFTDILVTDDDGNLEVIKTPSTPANPDQGVINGLKEIETGLGRSVSDITFFSHATTVATNAVLEDEWAKTALVTTGGFRDVLEIGRQTRPELYDFQAEKPTPIVPRRRRYEVRERVAPSGDIETKLNKQGAREIAAEIADSDATSVAVCFLNAFENPANEQQMADILEANTDVSVTLSAEVLPEIREYERTVTTAMSAGLQPVMAKYLNQIETSLSEMDVPASLNVMQSNGGVITSEAAREKAVNTLLSGPAAGVQGAVHVGEKAGYEDLITMDMGGTSCDISIVPDGDPVLSSELEVGEYPVRIPMIDLHTIGNGGGSKAWVDAGGALRVGPESAGAQPGPICYGRGGTDITITDAHTLLGRLDPSSFIGDGLGIPDGHLRDAFESDICSQLGSTPEKVAQDILNVANANMERALNVISTERGWDPRSFTLVAFGGAGPLHATALANRLNTERVLIPQYAGVLSALGLQVANTVYDEVQSFVTPWEDVSPERIENEFKQLETSGAEQLDAAGVPDTDQRFERSVDLRYVGQSFELSVDLNEPLTKAAMNQVAGRFHEKHEQHYGHANSEEPLKLVNLRVNAVGNIKPPELKGVTSSAGTVDEAQKTTRKVYFDGTPERTPVFDRQLLPVGGQLSGPAIIEGSDSTVTIYPEQSARTDERRNLVVSTGGEKQ